MRMLGKVCVFGSVLAAVCLLLSSVPVAALDRSSGDFWEYDVNMSYGVPDIGIMDLSGTMRHSFAEEDQVTVNDTEYDVNILDIEGSVSGEVDVLGMPVNLTIALSGYQTETAGGIATVTDDITMNVNLTVEVLGLPMTTITIMQTIDKNSPPYLDGFEPGDTGTGDSWEEVVIETTTSKMWMGSTGTDPIIDVTNSVKVTYDVVVADDRDEIETDAGTFDCLKITVTASGRDTEIFWVSEDVGYIVKKETRAQGSNTVTETWLLTDYEWTNPAMMLYIAIGVVVLIVAVGVLALVLMRRKKAKPTMAAPPPEPQQPGQ